MRITPSPMSSLKSGVRPGDTVGSCSACNMSLLASFESVERWIVATGILSRLVDWNKLEINPT